MTFNSKLVTFSLLIFVIGMILTYLTNYYHSKLPYKCVNKSVQVGINILLVLSTMMMVVPFVQLVCHLSCKCPPNDLWYGGIIASIGSLLVITASVVLSGLKDECQVHNVKVFMIGLIIIGSVITALVGILPFAVPAMREWIGNSRSRSSSSSSSSSSGGYYYPTESVESSASSDADSSVEFV
jgi:hypothetical protein